MHARFPLDANTAYMDERGGRAIICDATGHRFTLDVDRNELKDWDDVHVGMYLQPAMTPITTMTADAYPFTAVRDHLSLEHSKSRARYLFAAMIDPDSGVDLRKSIARVLQDELTEKAAVLTDLRAVVLEIGLPERASIPPDLPEGVIATLLRDVQEKWRQKTTNKSP